jgi:hypothetical protein
VNQSDEMNKALVLVVPLRDDSGGFLEIEIVKKIRGILVTGCGIFGGTKEFVDGLIGIGCRGSWPRGEDR